MHSGRFLTRDGGGAKTEVFMPPDLHRLVRMAAKLDTTTINDWVVEAVQARLAQPRYEGLQRAVKSTLPVKGNGAH